MAKRSYTKKQAEEPQAERPPIDPAMYSDFGSSLIRFGVLMMEKKNQEDGTKKLESGECTALVPTTSMEGFYDFGLGLQSNLSLQQVQFLNMRMAGISNLDACMAIGVDMATPMLWAEENGLDSVYGCCLDAIRKAEATVAEDVVWDRAIRGNKDLLLMFAVKSRLPEYRDNQPIQNQQIVKLDLRVNGETFKVVTETEPTYIGGNEK